MNEKNIVHWIEAIKNGDSLEREKIIETILLVHEKDIVPFFIPLLKDNDITIRMIAHGILSRIGNINIDAIIHLTEDDDADQRTYACEILGNTKNRKAIPPLIKCLGDDDINVRSAAAQALGNFKDKRVVTSLIHALNDNEWVAFSAISSLGKIKNKHALPYLLNIFREDNSTLSLSACEALLNYNKKDLLEEIIESLKQWDTKKRNEYLEVIYKRSNQHTFRIFKEKMGEEIFDFFLSKFTGMEKKNIHLLRNISIFKRKEALDAVLSFFHEIDPDLEEYDEAIKILSTFKESIKWSIKEYLTLDETSLLPLITVCAKCRIKIEEKELLNVFTSGSTTLKREIIRFLPRILKGNGTSLINEAIKDPDGHVRGDGFISAGKMKVKHLQKEIIQSCREDFFDVRIKAFHALIDLNKEAALNLIEEFIARGSSTDKKVYLHCTDRLTPDTNYSFLKKLCQDNDEEIRKKAIRAIGSLSDNTQYLDLFHQCLMNDNNIYPDVLGIIKEKGLHMFKERLIDIHSDTTRDVWTRYYALSALASFQDISLFPLFVRGLEEENKLLKIASIKALSALKDKKALTVLKPLLFEQDQEIRDAVSTVLKEFELS